MDGGSGYAWADTNCIDKSSNTEFFEAINLMFVWYAHSHMCFGVCYPCLGVWGFLVQ
ncbi:uncharacterized protein BCR38DRAFT_425186 [Pseudomassariella vexata]|uniref:Heterokaryon incompatibility domain-containing protein n=1 Tax=Pseudomassariella vexata TaxID=1141098 RepID=A0A1Y2ECT9_9PEZI|nr:uncharacterized protein BCR38DRAFT_425186 [Pseudomassariella vexata]ORY69066.1 hypothetical protein BCR38DRAFT_425186 [Pseudomassariella vexata]